MPHMPDKKRKQILIIVVVACLTLVIGDRLVLTPLLDLWQKRSQRIADLRQKIGKGAQVLDREAQLNTRWQEMRKGSLPADESVAQTQVLNGVSACAQGSALSVSSLKPRALKEKDCRKLEVRLSADGTLASIARFLYMLETAPQAQKVEEMELTARDEKGSQLSLDLRFTALALEEDKQ
jgi:hypothetical protein